MPRKGRDLEKLVALLEEHLGPEGIQVTSPDYIRGKESNSLREVDISLRGQLGSANILIIIECRDRQETEDVTWIEQLASKRKDVGANKAMAVSSSSFTSGAVNLASANDIDLRTMENVDPNEMLLWFSFDEMTAFKRSVDFARISIELSSLDDAKIELHPDVLAKLKPSFNTNSKVFLRKKDQNPASFMDVWASFSHDVIYSNVSPGGPKVKHRIRLNFPDDQERFQLLTTSGVVDIAYIDVYAELWIEIEKKPIDSIRVYRNEKETVAQSAEFEFEHMGKKLALGLHQLPHSGEQFVSVRAREDDDEIKVKLVFISLNDTIREYLKEIARTTQTATYDQLGLISDPSNREIELDRATVNRILGTISKEEHEEGKPLLSAVVVLADRNHPDEEFFTLARELGLYNGSDDQAFFAEELQRVYEYWQSDEAKTSSNDRQSYTR